MLDEIAFWQCIIHSVYLCILDIIDQYLQLMDQKRGVESNHDYVMQNNCPITVL